MLATQTPDAPVEPKYIQQVKLLQLYLCVFHTYPKSF